jgi:iron complex outermembrane receptor protein
VQLKRICRPARISVLTFTATLVLLPQLHAAAQGTPQTSSGDTATGASAANYGIPDIIVTANKREELISTVPTSIVALSTDALNDSEVKNITDIANLVPGIEFYGNAGYGSGTLSAITIRGIYSLVGASPTGIYVDDTPIQGRLNSLSFFGNPYPVNFDVARVEVDRGPQGTLFGAGAEGGALRYINTEPSLTETEGFAHSEVAFTQHGAPSYEAGVAVGAPIIINELGYRASVWYREDGGYVDRIDPFTGDVVQSNANSTQSYALKGAITYVPFDGLKITPSVDAQQIHNDDAQAYYEALSNPASERFVSARLLAQPNTDRFYIPSVKLEAQLGGSTLTSITSYFDRKGTLIDDLTSYNGVLFGGPAGYGNPLGPEYPTSYSDAGPAYLSISQRQISQELRLASNDTAAQLRWTVGVFYSHETQVDMQNVLSPFLAVNVFDIPAEGSIFDSTLESIDSQIAAFGQVDYRLTQALTVTVGARVGHTTSKYTQSQTGPLAAVQFPLAGGEQSENPVTPKIVLTYQLADNHMVYVSAAKGFRDGGANPPIPLQSAADPAGCPLNKEPAPYGSDSLWSYELGAKDAFFNGRLRINTSVFDVEWKKIQQDIYLADCGFGYVANTGSATSRGFDLAAETAATADLTLGLSLSYTDAFITSNSYTPDGSPTFLRGDAIGTPPGSLSPWDITNSAKYKFVVISGTESFVRLEDTYRSKNPGPFNSQIPTSPAYSPAIPPNPATNLLNGKLGTEWDKWQVSLFVNNLLDRHPALGRYNDIPPSPLFTDYTFRPRTLGLSANVRF